MKTSLAFAVCLFSFASAPPRTSAQAPLNNVILGHSGSAGSLGNLRRILDRNKIWEKHGLSVKSVYFSSGSVLTQAMAGGNIAGSESEVPGMWEEIKKSGFIDRLYGRVN